MRFSGFSAPSEVGLTCGWKMSQGMISECIARETGPPNPAVTTAWIALEHTDDGDDDTCGPDPSPAMKHPIPRRSSMIPRIAMKAPNLALRAPRSTP
jgi:hypothetical protein